MSKIKTKTLPLSNGSTAARQTMAPPETEPAGETLAVLYVTDVMGVCRMAGPPELAKQFIEKRISLETIRSAFLDAQAQADEALGIVGTPPLPGEETGATPRTLDEDAIFAARRRQMTSPAQGEESRS